MTSGKILATSRTAFLATECDRRFACGTYAYDRRTGTRRRVGPAVAEQSFPGALSPDGRHVVLQRWESTAAPTLAVIEVANGKEVASFPLREDGSYSDPSAVWLSDGRLIFLREARLAVFDPRTRQTARTSLRLPGLIQLAVRQPAG